MEKNDIKYLIAQHNNAIFNINNLEEACQDAKIKNDKDKANFGNLCIALHGYRMIADATEAILMNEDVLKDEKGNFYQKIEDEPCPDPNENGKPENDK